MHLRVGLLIIRYSFCFEEQAEDENPKMRMAFSVFIDSYRFVEDLSQSHTLLDLYLLDYKQVESLLRLKLQGFIEFHVHMVGLVVSQGVNP